MSTSVGDIHDTAPCTSKPSRRFSSPFFWSAASTPSTWADVGVAFTSIHPAAAFSASCTTATLVSLENGMNLRLRQSAGEAVEDVPSLFVSFVNWPSESRLAPTESSLSDVSTTA